VPRSAAFSLSDSAGTQVASLTGSGNAPATDTLSTSALIFAQQQLTITSPSQQVTLTNSGGVALTLISATVSSGDFAIVNTCGNSLAANSTCALSVTFTPTETGPRTATLTLADQFRIQTITLTGSGVAPPGVSLSPITLVFSATGVSLTSPAQTLTLTNNGGLPLAISNIAIASGFVIATNACGPTLAVNAACNIAIVFAPTTPGAASGALTLTTNATPAIQTATLTGIGVDFTLISTGSTTATLSSGSSAVYTLQLTSISALSNSVTLGCTGAPASSTCTIYPPSATLGTTTPLTVTIATGTTLTSLPPGHSNIFVALLFPLALPLVLLTTRRRKALPLALTLLVSCALAASTGCAINRLIPVASPSNPTYVPTPSGSYNITISATSASLTHTVGLILIVK
jgi:hypothetical protein